MNESFVLERFDESMSDQARVLSAYTSYDKDDARWEYVRIAPYLDFDQRSGQFLDTPRNDRDVSTFRYQLTGQS